MFVAGVFLQRTPWVVQIRNFSVSVEGESGVQRDFQTVAQKIPEGAGVVVPWPWILSQSDMGKLKKIASKRPRNPKDFSDLLGTINRRTAHSSMARGAVSEHCVVTYLPPQGDGMQTHIYNAAPGSPQIITPTLLFGIDLTDMQRHVMQLLHST